MLVTRNLQPSLWDSVLPAEVRRLSPLLERVDRWLDDEVFFAPFREHSSAVFGRPSIPVEVYLRMFLKFQYRMGYESLCREVGDSISWRIFCRLNLDASVPAPSTLSKITTRCGEDAVLTLNTAMGRAVRWWFPGRWVGLPHQSAGSADWKRAQYAG